MVKGKDVIVRTELMGLDRKETFDQLDEIQSGIALTVFWTLPVGEWYAGTLTIHGPSGIPLAAASSLVRNWKRYVAKSDMI